MCADTPQTPEYKSTLNLPRTDFPMRAGLPKREPVWLERWAEMGIYSKLREKAALARAGENGKNAETRQPFTLHDGPPYANGHLHIGHALNKTIKDMIVRSHQMMGRDARYIPGWDCHGLPIEWKIEEQYRKKGRDKDQVPINEFRGECREFAAGWVDIQREEFKRLGIQGNWENPYLTMDFHAERVIAEEFMKFLMNGTLYQGSKPVMWSPVEQTALAEAEVEYHDKDSFTVWVKFEVVDNTDFSEVSPEEFTPTLRDEKFLEITNGKDADAAPQAILDYLKPYMSLSGAKVVIWTTTPWTMPSNKAVVYGAGISYGLYEITGTPDECWANIGDRYLLADNLAADVLGRARLEEGNWTRVRDVTNEELEGISLKHPLAGAEGGNGEWDDLRDFRAAEFVTDTEGTGFVHCAPSHGLEEYDLYRELGMLEQVITYNVMPDGRYRDDLPFFGGKAILKPNGKEGNANSAVIDKLVEVGGLLARGKIKHSYPHSWRSKAPVIYRNTPQWFAAIDKAVGDGQDMHGTTIRERALTEIDNVNWTPKSGRNRLHAMMEARPDWVLSRQRAWGVPLTCFTLKGKLPTDPDFLLRNADVNSRIVEAFEVEGADAWYEDGAKERFLGGIVNPDDYNQVTDILDVWFDSGSTHAFTLRDREDGSEDGIADVYMEGTDQHRGWFHSSLLQSVGTTGHAPYRNVVTHGFTLDAKGMKMSKSVGNTIVPQKIVDQYGADILRLWVAQTDYTNDQRIGDEILKGTADSYRRLRNTMRYMLGSLPDFDASKAVAVEDMPELEQLILHKLAVLDGVVREGYAKFDFQGVFRAIFDFATLDLSSFYFDIRKDALYCDSDTPRRLAALTVLDHLYSRLTTWLAPILPFTMEEVWLERNGEETSVHLVDFPATPTDWRNDALAARSDTVRAVRRVVTGALEEQRTAKVIGSSLEAGPTVYLSPELAQVITDPDTFADLCITSQITIVEGDAPEGAFTLPDSAGVGVVFAKADGEKCARCWKVLPDVGKHSHEGVCVRCDTAL